MPDGIVCTDCYKSYDVLDMSEFTHHRINHLQTVKTISTALKISEIRHSAFYENIMELTANLSSIFSVILERM
ncbi:putative transposase [Neisseria musculi]|uniref:Transposase n=1 Tax=Neisseria musculi TaxID=1815583 RepID=A0A7H1MEX4_9NEIS|nr:putative transposase [Neisseria musculi]